MSSHHSDTPKVVQFHRKPYVGAFSIEGLFETLREEMRRQGWNPTAYQLPYYSRGLVPRIRSLLDASRHQGDVNHITGDVHFLAMAMEPRKTILTIHDLEILKRLQGFRRILVKAFWFRLPVRRAAWITVISNATRSELLRQFPHAASKVRVIPDVVSPIFQPTPYEFNESKPTILHIGTKANKNLPRLTEAIQGMNVRLLVIGVLSEPQRAFLLQHKIDFENRTNLTQAELVAAYREADLVSFVSTCEGFGLPILEAQAIERPLITSNLSSMPEIAGDGALLCDPYSVTSIRSAIEQVIRRPQLRNELLDKGRINRKRFSISSVATQYLDLYTEVIRSSTTR